jgi:hypothetical protein
MQLGELNPNITSVLRQNNGLFPKMAITTQKPGFLENA